MARQPADDRWVMEQSRYYAALECENSISVLLYTIVGFRGVKTSAEQSSTQT